MFAQLEGQIGEMFIGGEFWVNNAGPGAATMGMKAYANNATVAVSFAAAGATVAGSTETKWFAQSPAAAGELVKMTTIALG